MEKICLTSDGDGRLFVARIKI